MTRLPKSLLPSSLEGEIRRGPGPTRVVSGGQGAA